MEAELERQKDLEKETQSKDVHMSVETLEVITLRRKDDVERMWKKGTEGLVELRKIPGVLAKLERAEKAVEVVSNNI